MRICLLASFLLALEVANAQNVTIGKVELAGEKIIVHYSLQDSNPSNEYQLNLFCSNDNFSSALTKVSGDVGNEVKPGIDKKVEWKIRDEYGPFKGKISLELRGKVYVPFVKLQGFDVNKKYKRGKPMDLGWRIGSTNPINIELLKGSQRVMGENNLQNNGNHTLYIPPSAKPGKDYRLKISDTRTNDVIYTSNFAIKPKLPLLIKILPILAIGGGATVLLGGKKDSGSGVNPIELPPLPGN
jgi:hypothetical protein